MAGPEFDADLPEPQLSCRHFLACHTIWYDAANPDAGWSLGRVIVHVRPADAGGYPFVVPRLFVFFQLFGATGEHLFRVELVRLEHDEEGNEVESTPIEFGPWECQLPGEKLVEGFAVSLEDVPFGELGLYEFRLRVDGLEGLHATEQVEARE